MEIFFGETQCMRFTETEAKVGAEIHAFTSGKSDNGSSGITWGGDSKEDKKAIVNGYAYGEYLTK